MTIVEFLTARLRDDESYALEAAKEFGPDWIEIWSGQIDLSANLPERQPPDNRPWDAHVQTNDSRVSRYMVRYDPARVLREVAAKRAIVEFCDDDPLFLEGGYAYTDRALRLLAMVYDNHPDFNQAWRIDT